MSTVLPERGTKPQGTKMSIAVTWAKSLEQRERQRVSSKEEARKSIARRLKIGVGTFENIVRDRVKRVDAAIRDKLQALVVSELEAEISRLTHELQMVRQCGSHLASEQVSEIEAHLEKARKLLNGGGHE